MIKKYGLLMFFITLSLLSVFFVSAVEHSSGLGEIKQASCVRLPQTCGNCTAVNASSILYPVNRSVAASNIVFARVSGTDEWNGTFCATMPLGGYIANVNEDVDGYNTPVSYNFVVTTTGYPTFIVLWAMMIMVIIAFAMMILGVTLKNAFFGIISGFIFLALGAFVISYGLNEWQNVYTDVLGYLGLGLGLFLMIVGAYEGGIDGAPISEDD